MSVELVPEKRMKELMPELKTGWEMIALGQHIYKKEKGPDGKPCWRLLQARTYDRGNRQIEEKPAEETP